jgi:soluble lytic murein transglycosylase-like protein
VEQRRPNGARVADRRMPAREDLRTLLGYRWVRVLLIASAAFPLVSVAHNSSEGEQLAVLETNFATAPVADKTAQVTGAAQAWRTKAIEREGRRVAEKYLKRGYEISPQLAADIQAAAIEHGIHPEIAFGLVRAESSFRNSATSHVGAVGMTQLMPRTAAWMQPGVTRRQLRDQKTNLRIGFKYLRYLIDYYEGDERLALLAYNRGPGTVDKVLKRGGNPDNGYVEKVMGP